MRFSIQPGEEDRLTSAPRGYRYRNCTGAKQVSANGGTDAAHPRFFYQIYGVCTASVFRASIWRQVSQVDGAKMFAMMRIRPPGASTVSGRTEERDKWVRFREVNHRSF